MKIKNKLSRREIVEILTTNNYKTLSVTTITIKEALERGEDQCLLCGTPFSGLKEDLLSSAKTDDGKEFVLCSECGVTNLLEKKVLEKKAKIDNTATINNKLFCKDCGWPIVSVCCNDEFKKFKDASEWDWWYYCSNKGCKNHDGEGVFQSKTKWVFNIE